MHRSPPSLTGLSYTVDNNNSSYPFAGKIVHRYSMANKEPIQKLMVELVIVLTAKNVSVNTFKI